MMKFKNLHYCIKKGKMLLNVYYILSSCACNFCATQGCDNILEHFSIVFQ